MNPRTAEVVRNTAETRVRVRVNLDGTGERRLASGVPFPDHMLDQLARHGPIHPAVEARGALHLDSPHTAADLGLPLGMASALALPDHTRTRPSRHACVPPAPAPSVRGLCSSPRCVG